MSNLEIINQKQETVEENDLLAFAEESEKGFSSEVTLHQNHLKKINKLPLSLDKKQVFNDTSYLKLTMNNLFKRKNEIVYCVSTKEMSIDISDTSGQVYLPLITKNEISKRLSKLPEEVRKKISILHLGAVKILIKAQFRNGIDTPVKMALIDNRINDRNDCILGAAKGNLAYGKFMFTVYPKFGLSLQTANLDQVLSFVHDFERSNLMNKGDKVFSITYLVGYALTNSHHSIDYRNKESIEIDDVFQEIGGKTEEATFCELIPEDNSWAINIAKNKEYLGPRRSVSTRNNKLLVGSSSRRGEITLSSISKRIEDFASQLQGISDDDH